MGMWQFSQDAKSIFVAFSTLLVPNQQVKKGDVVAECSKTHISIRVRGGPLVCEGITFSQLVPKKVKVTQKKDQIVVQFTKYMAKTEWERLFASLSDSPRESDSDEALAVSDSDGGQGYSSEEWESGGIESDDDGEEGERDAMPRARSEAKPSGHAPAPPKKFKVAGKGGGHTADYQADGEDGEVVGLGPQAALGELSAKLASKGGAKAGLKHVSQRKKEEGAPAVAPRGGGAPPKTAKSDPLLSGERPQPPWAGKEQGALAGEAAQRAKEREQKEALRRAASAKRKAAQRDAAKADAEEKKRRAEQAAVAAREAMAAKAKAEEEEKQRKKKEKKEEKMEKASSSHKRRHDAATSSGGSSKHGGEVYERDPDDEREFVVAKYAYTASGQGELSFQKGCCLQVLLRDESGWWQGELACGTSGRRVKPGRKGWFPMNYSRPMDDDDYAKYDLRRRVEVKKEKVVEEKKEKKEVVADESSSGSVAPPAPEESDDDDEESVEERVQKIEVIDTTVSEEEEVEEAVVSESVEEEEEVEVVVVEEEEERAPPPPERPPLSRVLMAVAALYGDESGMSKGAAVDVLRSLL